MRRGGRGTKSNKLNILDIEKFLTREKSLLESKPNIYLYTHRAEISNKYLFERIKFTSIRFHRRVYTYIYSISQYLSADSQFFSIYRTLINVSAKHRAHTYQLIYTLTREVGGRYEKIRFARLSRAVLKEIRS